MKMKKALMHVHNSSSVSAAESIQALAEAALYEGMLAYQLTVRYGSKSRGCPLLSSHGCGRHLCEEHRPPHPEANGEETDVEYHGAKAVLLLGTIWDGLRFFSMFQFLAYIFVLYRVRRLSGSHDLLH